MLSRVPECKKAVMCLMEKICVLAKLQSDMGYSTVGYAKDSTIILNKMSLTHIKQGCILIT